RILRQNVGLGDGEAKLLQPFVRHRWMEERALQSRKLTIRADKVLCRHEKPGGSAGSPLRGSLQLSHRLGNLRPSICRDTVIWPRRVSQGPEHLTKTGGTEKNKSCAKDQEKRGDKSQCAIVIRPKPF